jgi:hypothetical protein
VAPSLVHSPTSDGHPWVSAPLSNRPVATPLARTPSSADEWRWRPEIFFLESEGIYHRRAVEAWRPRYQSDEFRSGATFEVAGSR